MSSSSRLNRRGAPRLGLAATAAAGAASLVGPAAAAPVSATGIEHDAGKWKIYFIPSGSALRLGPPPDNACELAQVRARAGQRDGVHGQVSYGDAGSSHSRVVEACAFGRE